MNRLRRSHWLIGLALLVAVGLADAPRAQARPPCPGDHAPGVVLARFRAPLSTTEQSGQNIVAVIPGIDVVAIRTPIGQECAVRDTLARDPHVAFTELDHAIHAAEAFIPNDPGWPNQWGPLKMGAPVAWSITTGAPHVVIAVLDSGTQLTHPDLAANLWTNPGELPDNGLDDDGNGKADDIWGWHFYHEWAWDGTQYTYLPRQDNRVADDYGHGTHVAGIAAARIHNGVGIAGMAGTARLMTVKVLDQYGNGWYSDLAQGIVYAVDNGARVINISAGGKPSSQMLQEAVDYAHARGALVVAAAGNDGGAVLYPAACEGALAVAATDQNDLRASFSNHGPQVDVAAPGVSIYSTWYRGNYFIRSGTSMATPHVAGLAALIWSARPHLTSLQVSEIITATASDVNSGTLQLPGWDEYLGWGRIDAARALSATIQMPTGRYLYLPLILH